MDRGGNWRPLITGDRDSRPGREQPAAGPAVAPQETASLCPFAGQRSGQLLESPNQTFYLTVK